MTEKASIYELFDKKKTAPATSASTAGTTAGGSEPRTAPERPADPAVSTLDRGEEETFWNARPELSTIHQYAQARRVGPWAVLGGVLARVVTSMPPSVVLPPLIGGYGSLNVFIALVGNSAGGKSTSSAALTELWKQMQGPDVTELNIGSGEGIVAAYVRREQTEKGQPAQLAQHTESVLFSVAEVDTLTALSRRTGSTLLGELRKVWSGEALGFQNADADRRLSVGYHHYRAALVLGVQPGRAQPLLDAVDGGTPQRFIWVPAADATAPENAPALPEVAPWTPPTVPPSPDGFRQIRVCSTARSAIDRNRLASLRGEGDAINGHAMFSRLKTAAALALLNGRAYVDEEDWHLAGQVMVYSDATRSSIQAHLDAEKVKRNEVQAIAKGHAAAVTAETTTDRLMKRARAAILRNLDANRAGVVASELSRSMRSNLREHFEPAAAELLSEQLIRAEEITYRGQPGTRYHLAT